MVLKRRIAVPLVGLLLWLGTLALYFPTLQNGFVNYDDPDYVAANANVQRGLTLNNLKWAFTSTEQANWHPLTWMSHMVDVQLFGLKPRGAHGQSVVWHAFNVVLLFLLLASATKFIGRSAFVAGWFAVHPLNVESVAWIAERKTVLSTFFLLLALGAYGWYRKRPQAGRYLLVALLFVFGLMAKPMVITLPFLLILVDYWPLQRFPEVSFPRLVFEKLPLLAVSAASAVITLLAQRVGGALGSTQSLPLSWRIGNAFYSYLIYVEKAAWPSRLAVFYPHPEASLAFWKTASALLLLIAVTTLCWHFRERRYLLAGWMWFVAALVPVIGIVQVGRQAWADRYAYFPLWGLFVIVVWALSEVAARAKLSRAAKVAIALAMLLGYAAAARIQLGYWKDSYSLFARAVAVTPANPIAEGNLGSALMELKRPDLALPHLQRAIQLMPTLPAPHYNLATLLYRQNQLEAARQEYQLALTNGLDPREAAQAHNNLGVLLNQLGHREEAVAEFTQAIALNPNEQNSLIGRGIIEESAGNLDLALHDFQRAADVSSAPVAFYWQGRVLEKKGELRSAAESYRRALTLAPAFADAQERLDKMEKAVR